MKWPLQLRSFPPPDLLLWVLLLAATLPLAGCFQRAAYVMGPVNEMIPELPDHCGAAAQADLTGQDFTLLADRPVAGRLRVIWPGQEVSGDLDSTRLDAQVDNAGRIKRLFCG